MPRSRFVAGSIIANAPTEFRYLWEVKAAAMSFAGIGLLLLDPGKALAVLSGATGKL